MAIRLDLNNRGFQRQWFALEKEEPEAVLQSCVKVLDTHRSIQSRRAPDGSCLYSIRIANKMRAVVRRSALVPRLSFAGTPGGSTKTVIRTGYGIAFDPVATFQVTSVASAVPGQVYGGGGDGGYDSRMCYGLRCAAEPVSE